MKNFTINELRENRAKSWEAAKAFLDSHRTENGMLSAEDSAVYDRMEAEIIALGKEIERMERSAALEAELSRPVGSPLTNIPGSAIDTKTGRASDAYKHSFLTALRSNFRQVSNVLTEGTDTSGGYLVPDEYDERLIEKLDAENVMRSLGTVIQTSGERKINVAASKPAASWIEEGGELVFSDLQFSQIILDAYKLSVAVKVSEELLADHSYDLEGWLINSFSRALANSEEEAMVIGDGISKPTGILTSGEVGITTAGNKIEADEIIDLIYKLKRPYRTNAVFLTADSTLAAIRKLKDSTGQYLWQPALTASEPDCLLGYPVYTSAFVPAVAAGKPVLAFGDMSYYNIGDRGVRSFAALHELYAGVGQVAFVCKERVDGKLVLPEAVQIMKMKGTAANNG
ncbi:MAG: phage major capsid protein [Ruminococcus sp.]|uniref:phage major capsid protein n=1 Tax=Ruminococcus sp. TaxID=41978 RepID=UPI0025E8CBD5|nr:phage major capsid protein [Ruminococcus sp.]MCR5599527.1 phage major capsid protein [Ruminococcus sp.]